MTSSTMHWTFLNSSKTKALGYGSIFSLLWMWVLAFWINMFSCLICSKGDASKIIFLFFVINVPNSNLYLSNLGPVSLHESMFSIAWRFSAICSLKSYSPDCGFDSIKEVVLLLNLDWLDVLLEFSWLCSSAFSFLLASSSPFNCFTSYFNCFSF